MREVAKYSSIKDQKGLNVFPIFMPDFFDSKWFNGMREMPIGHLEKLVQTSPNGDFILIYKKLNEISGDSEEIEVTGYIYRGKIYDNIGETLDI